ncbi:MAG: amino acid ABC transporter permease [Eubacterium sp.]|nr:amino acid ABC transporter permease [Eubacterium sp.]
MSGFDPSYIFTALGKLVTALPVVLLILILSMSAGMILGLLFTIIRLKRIPVLHYIVSILISFLRGTPQIVQLFLVYYGIPQVLRNMGIEVSVENRVLFVVITFSLNSSATFSEAFRGAYMAVEPGQMEATWSIGMTGFQGFRSVIFPQAFRVLLPNLGNLAVRMLQATSLAFSIGVVDLMGRAKIIDDWTYGVNRLAIYIAVSLIYWGICLLLEFVIHRLEKAYSFGHVHLSKVRG